MSHGCHGQHRGSAGSPFRRKGTKFRGLAPDRAVEYDVALLVQAEAETLGNEPARQASLICLTGRSHPQWNGTH